MIDYTHFYRSKLSLTGNWGLRWDYFISGYNTVDRVPHVFSLVEASHKYWLIHKEYKFDVDQHPDGECLMCDNETEDEDILGLFDRLFCNVQLSAVKICVDITGMMRPHLMLLVRVLKSRGVEKLDVIYSEPSFYSGKENTQFTSGFVNTVRQVYTYEGVSSSIETNNDVLIIGAGYEDELIKEVADEKEMAKKIMIYGFPSLHPDMYQENLLRTRRAADAIGGVGTVKHFAPANDPFVTASVLSEIVERENALKTITNLYLSPLATKAQALGFAIFYLTECENSNTSVIYPFSSQYVQGTSEGISKIWLYTLEF